ncbi:Rv2640c family ArsR-like transcriptional regulator [Rhodococcus sp. NPDC058521]|uniref:Rv2640c family ArsR-like transcriptional regulator n=1 Tax=Rhodococcus sp. NPDC058521 TaxID=3346536 RepID=UPI00364DD0C8
MPKTLPVVDMNSPICCSPVSAGVMSDGDALELALRLKALADPVRIRLMSMLLAADGGEACTCDLAVGVDLRESTVSHHLGQLKKAGMVSSARRGMNVFYSTRPECLDALRLVLDPNCCTPGRN